MRALGEQVSLFLSLLLLLCVLDARKKGGAKVAVCVCELQSLVERSKEKSELLLLPSLLNSAHCHLQFAQARAV